MTMTDNKEMSLAWRYVAGTRVSVFLTGKAGTGKTTFLHRLRESLDKRMVVLAPTGVAAINAGGQTIHSFFQLPFSPFVPGMKLDLEHGAYRMRQEKKNMIRTMDLLVIDEISMVRGDLLDAIDDVMRRYRQPSLPFGGVQLLLIGDLQQLAPVVTDNDRELLASHYPSPYFFSSRALQQTPYITIELRHIYRQQDTQFIDLLAAIRENRVTPDVVRKLNARYIPNFTPHASKDANGERWIRLTTHNRMADEYNSRQLAALSTATKTYKAKIDGKFPELSYPTDATLTIKKGAQVMFVKNDNQYPRRFYNGKIGTVEKLEKDSVTVRTKNDNGVGETLIKVEAMTWENMRYTLDPRTKDMKEEVEGTFTQFPLRLAWAITVHKSQGLTFSHAVLDINNSFAHGQVYVALSRCRTLEGLVLTAPLYDRSVITDYDVNAFLDTSLQRSSNSEEQLPQHERGYFYQLLCELFTFDSLARDFENLRRTAMNNLSDKQETLFTLLRTATDRLSTDVLQVAIHFKTQYDALVIAAGQQYATDETLQERVRKGAGYFSKKVTDVLLPVIAGTRIVLTGLTNKAVQKQLQAAIESLNLSYNIKIATLRQTEKDGFAPSGYIASKAKATLSDGDSSKKAKGK